MSDAEELAQRLLSETREEIARADAKATTLFAGVGVAGGAVLAGLLSGGVSLARLNGPAQVFCWLAIVAVLVGLGFLVAAVTPRLGMGRKSPVHYYADVSAFGDDVDSLEDEITSAARSGLLRRDVSQLLAISKIVKTKYTQIRWAIWIINIGTLAAIVCGLIQIATN